MPRKKNKKPGKRAPQKQIEEEVKNKAEAGTRAFLSRNYSKAVEFYTGHLAENPNDHKVLSNRSAAFCELSAFDKALVDAEAVITMMPEWPKGYLRAGRALLGKYKYTEAKARFDNGLSVDANDALLQAGLAECTEAISELKLSESEMFSNNNPDAAKIDSLVKWLEDGGVIFPKLYMQWYSADFRGVHALTKVNSGELILSVPISHIMVGEEAKKCTMGRRIVTSGYEVTSDDSYLAAMLLQEKHTEDSFWKPYIDSLPQHYANMPIYFGEELLAELQGSFSLEMREMRIESLREEYDGICSAVPEFRSFTHDEFVWARLVVITRQFGVSVDGVETDGLVPYADMLNHKLPRETEWTYDEKSRAFTIHALQPLARGGQIFDSYGRKCNSRFFVNYGFSLDENPDNEAVIRLELPANQSPSYNIKMSLLGNNHYSRRRRCQIPANYVHKKTQNMFSFLRFIHAEDQDLVAVTQLEAKNGDIKIAPLSIANETAVLTELKEKALYALSLFKTTIEEDEKLKDTVPMYSNIRNCFIMRLGEKKVLQFFVDLATVCLPMLKLTWRQIKSSVSRYSKSGIDKYILHAVAPLVKARR